MRALGGVLGVALLVLVSLVRADELPCREDPALTASAASLLLSDVPVEASDLLAHARAQGFEGVALHARESARDEVLQGWLGHLQARGDGELVCGEARSATRRLLLASLRGGGLTRRGDVFSGELVPGFVRPQLVVERVDGVVAAHELSREELRAGVRVPELATVRRVQLLAESAHGPRPVAELSLPRAEVDREPHSAEAEDAGTLAALPARLQRTRREAGVGTLRENRLLAESARRHAERVCAASTLVHRLEGEDPAARLAREHIAARSVGEALARASSIAAAYRVLLASPSHRLALTRREFTDVGFGQALDRRGQVCLVVLLAGWPRRTP